MRQSILTTFHLFLIFFSVSLQGQDISDVAGSWSGYIDADDRQLAINLTFSYSDDILDGTIDIPDQGAFTLPLEVTDTSDDKLVFQFETGSGPAVFFASRNGSADQISGEFNQSGETFPFTINRNTLNTGLISDVPESKVIISIGDGEIGGTLTLRNERAPLVILISGSGSQDRDKNIGGFLTFQKLASELYALGYSAFRYDDPGIGESAGETDITLQEMAVDLKEVVDTLRSQHSESISGIILLGHNQGGLVASLAANEPSVDGVILAATPFLKGEEIITEQIRKISEIRDISDEIVQKNLQFQEKVYDVVRTDAGWQDIESELTGRLEAQIRELPLEHQNALGDMAGFIQSQVDRQLETAKSRWFKSWIETDPVKVIGDLNVPTLALFGEKDTQVLPQSNQEVADSLASASDILLRTSVIEDANHLFQEANTGMSSEYGMLEQEFAEGFISEIDQFLNSIQFRSLD